MLAIKVFAVEKHLFIYIYKLDLSVDKLIKSLLLCDCLLWTTLSLFFNISKT